MSWRVEQKSAMLSHKAACRSHNERFLAIQPSTNDDTTELVWLGCNPGLT